MLLHRSYTAHHIPPPTRLFSMPHHAPDLLRQTVPCFVLPNNGMGSVTTWLFGNEKHTLS